jgi:hypothetical protein
MIPHQRRMNPYIQCMVEDMKIRNFSDRTIDSYTWHHFPKHRHPIHKPTTRRHFPRKMSPLRRRADPRRLPPAPELERRSRCTQLLNASRRPSRLWHRPPLCSR